MTECADRISVITNFWEWYQRRQECGASPLARYALDKCEEAYRRSEWDRFGYWFEIYRRERPRRPNFGAEHPWHSD